MVLLLCDFLEKPNLKATSASKTEMFPSKTRMDYTTEMNRLFSRPENDLLQSNAYSLAAQSSFNSTINRSSSSADSTSPESFPEISVFRPEYSLRATAEPFSPMYSSPPLLSPPLMNYESRPMYDTPKSSGVDFFTGRNRSIVGRKILTETSTPAYERVQAPQEAKLPEINEFPLSFWQDDPMMYQFSPPKFNHYLVENKNYTQNVYYDLFPTENKGYEFKTPVKTSPTPSVMSNMSSMSNWSPPSMSRSPLAPNLSFYQESRSSFYPDFPTSSKQKDVIQKQKICTFCRKNGETPLVYMKHLVKEKFRNKFIVTCPILRSHVCTVCGATGDNAHTITYCPVLRNSNNGHPIQSTTVQLKSTRIKSNGRRRY